MLVIYVKENSAIFATVIQYIYIYYGERFNRWHSQ